MEEWIKTQIIKYLEKKELILQNHHGGLLDQSTLTAKTVSDHHCHTAIDEDKLDRLSLTLSE